MWPRERAELLDRESGYRFVRILTFTKRCSPCHIGEDQTVLQEPRLLHYDLHPRVIRSSIDLIRCFPESYENVLDLHVRVGTIADRRLFQQFRK